MNEHQTQAGTTPGQRDSPLSSPGGNSPVLGSHPIPATPVHGTTHADASRSARQPGISHPEQRRYPRQDLQTAKPTDQAFPMIAASIGGGLLLGWMIASLAQPRRREHEGEQDGNRGKYAQSASRSTPTDETWDLIASDKVEGTAVYDRNGERLGSVYNFMVGKRSGQVAYAVMSFGGWLGMGENYHPLPWSSLTYDTGRGGYVVSLNKDRLRGAPSHKAGEDTASDANYWDSVKNYWR